MFLSLRKRMMGAITDHDLRPRNKWILSHPNQIVLTVSQIMWARSVHAIFTSIDNVEKLMKDFETTCYVELNKLAEMVRGDLQKLQRTVLCSLITIDVHARDNITNLVNGRVTKRWSTSRPSRNWKNRDNQRFSQIPCNSMMGRFFSGLAQSGAWCCFDEFNRIDIEVLSVIAQQLITIRNAKAAKLQRFMFEGREIKLIQQCAAFITMNPGYAALIAEVILYSEGFESSKLLANKMTQMYKLCSEQLSQQDHYDFGMRAVKSVLVMAGSLKRNNPKLNEDVGILNDLFPGIVIPEQDYGVLEEAIRAVMIEHNLQPEQCIITKIMKNALTKLYIDKVKNQYYRPVRTYILNPKSVTLGELYGEVNPFTLEWRDGLLGIMVRTAVQFTTEDHQWVICDGPVDAVWIENMNTVLDDNKMLCLANSERIKLTPYVHMIFEVMDLAQASPATVSRCGMVYIDPDELKWLPYVRSWLAELPVELPEGSLQYIEDLFKNYIEDGFTFIKKNCDQAIRQVDISKATMMCKIMESLMIVKGAVDMKADKLRVRSFLCQSFLFAYVWSLGGNIIDSSREMFEMFVRSQLEEHPDARFVFFHILLLHLHKILNYFKCLKKIIL
ncbi:Dynein heavy chain 6 [Blattella germanica]|nr:Dynein heavy chain 6 [Blattella germanica]